jgi:uncharacterized protein DUF6220
VSVRIHMALLGLFLLGLLVQFYLAGRGVFGASSFSAHKDLGGILHLGSLLILVVTAALPATRTRVDIGLAAALFVLVTVQASLADFKHPESAAFHPVLALSFFAVAGAMMRRDRERVGRPA